MPPKKTRKKRIVKQYGGNLDQEWKDWYARGDAYAPPPHIIGKPIVDPYVHRKRWYERGPIGFIKENKIASQILGKIRKPWGRWLEQKGWGNKKVKVKKNRKVKKK